MGKDLYAGRDLDMAGVSPAETQIPTQLQRTVGKAVTVKEKDLCYLTLKYTLWQITELLLKLKQWASNSHSCKVRLLLVRANKTDLILSLRPNTFFYALDSPQNQFFHSSSQTSQGFPPSSTPTLPKYFVPS